MPTRSPGSTPRERSPAATRRAASRNSSKLRWNSSIRSAGPAPSFAAVSSRFCARLVIVDLFPPRRPDPRPTRSTGDLPHLLDTVRSDSGPIERKRRPVTILDKFRLDGRVAIVTGASSGLGVVFARALAEAGAAVARGARRVERLAEAQRA